MAGIDPLSIATSGLQTALGLGQLLFSGKRKAERNFEKHIAGFKPNAGIMDYYNKALQRYSANPYTSALYNQQTKNINRNINAGIGAFQDRRSGVAGISSLVQLANDASLRAAGAAEQQQGQNLSQLGQATQIKAAEQAKPFDMKFNLLAQKASGANKTAAAGIQNIFGGLQTWQGQKSLENKGVGGISGGGNYGGTMGGGYGGFGGSNYLNKWGGFRDIYQ